MHLHRTEHARSDNGTQANGIATENNEEDDRVSFITFYS